MATKKTVIIPGAGAVQGYTEQSDGTQAMDVNVVGGSAGGGSGGGPATIADGADVAEGARADPAATNNTSSWSVVALLKGLYGLLSQFSWGPAGGQKVEGAQANAVALTANPVAVGGIVGAVSGLVNGSLGLLRLDSRGSLQTTIFGQFGNQVTVTAPNTDVAGVNSAGLTSLSNNYVYDLVADAWRRCRGNADGTFSVPNGSADANAAIVPSVTTVASASLTAKAAAGNVYSIGCTTGATAGYLMLFDSATVPGDGTVQPKKTIPVAANTAINKDFPIAARMGSGITLVFSSTGPFTKTASATAFLEAMVK